MEKRNKRLGYKLVYARYIRKKGRIIYPKKAKCFRFWVKVN